MVPGGGFEPPTRGFSIRCSTPELPGQAKQGSGVLAPLLGNVQYGNCFFADARLALAIARVDFQFFGVRGLCHSLYAVGQIAEIVVNEVAMFGR